MIHLGRKQINRLFGPCKVIQSYLTNGFLHFIEGTESVRADLGQPNFPHLCSETP